MTQKKDEEMVRILFQNVGGIGFMSGDVNQESVKIEKLKRLIIGKSIDIHVSNSKFFFNSLNLSLLN